MTMIKLINVATGKPLLINPEDIQTLTWCWWKEEYAQFMKPYAILLDDYTVGSTIYVHGVRWFVRETPSVIESLMQKAMSARTDHYGD